MPAAWDIGDSVPLTWKLYAVDGTTPVDATVSLTITLPDGTSSSPAVTHAATGVYTATYSPASSGTFPFRFVATGAVSASEEGAFRVRVPGTNLIAVQDVRARLNKSLTVDNDEIQDMIDAACAEYVQYVGPLGGTVTEAFDGGGTALVLAAPTATITAAAYSDGTVIAPSDLTARNGIVRWGYGTAGRFTYGTQNVTITYTAGSLPANHREGIIDAVAWYFKTTQRMGGGARPAFTGEAGGTPEEPFYESASWGAVQDRIRALRSGSVVA